MKCISVYTNNFDVFSDIYEQIIDTPLTEDEEQSLNGVTFSESGEVPGYYLQKMKTKPDVVVMKIRDRDITILQHGEMFEIMLPTEVDAGYEHAMETVRD